MIDLVLSQQGRVVASVHYESHSSKGSQRPVQKLSALIEKITLPQTDTREP
ncbi:hypothetical protein [Paraburkholderia sp.]|uniref:hypothetical protein n=1 Tax=Paraburkholderia sp. TaxID=1926495 RepID=UPI0023831D65|nr:hypothetical protein [Paraburkholderia sp.]MDE1182383.1 hypothetical protein [Paraburkholderia sp.]